MHLLHNITSDYHLTFTLILSSGVTHNGIGGVSHTYIGGVSHTAFVNIKGRKTAFTIYAFRKNAIRFCRKYITKMLQTYYNCVKILLEAHLQQK